MKLTLKTPKPRNPFVAAARMRQAGRHGDRTAQRRQARRELRAELDRLPMST
jgi:hypothetical protein